MPSLNKAAAAALRRDESVNARATSPTFSAMQNIRRTLASPGPMAAMHVAKSYALQRRKYISDHANNVIDLCICIASIVGALTIIIPYAVNRRSRKLRHSLILGLATSDLVSSLIIMATTAYQIAGGDLNTAHKFCTFAGFIFSASLWTQHLWNLSIAGITYMILVHPLSNFVGNVERHLVWLWPLFWAIAMIAQGIAWAEVGFVNVDGYCTYNPKTRGALFPSIFQFVPRAFVVLTILVLYTHLFFFLRRTNLFSAAASNGSRRRISQATSAGPWRGNGVGETSQGTILGQDAEDADTSANNNVDMPRSASLGRTASAMLAKVKNTCSLSSPLHGSQGVEALSSTTMIASSSGSSSKRNGSASTQGKASSSGGAPISLLQSLNGLDYNGAGVSPKQRALGEDSLQAQQRELPSHMSAVAPHAQEALQASSDDVSSTMPDVELPADRSSKITVDPLYTPMHMRKDVRDFGMTSPPQEHLKHLSLSPTGVKLARKVKDDQVPGNSIDDSLRQQRRDSTLAAGSNLSKQEQATLPASLTYEDTLGPDWQWGMPVQGASAGPRGTAAKSGVLGASEGKKSKSRKRSSYWTFWQTASKRGDGFGTSSSGSSREENGVDATGSTLNRQASVLLLLYPAVYVCLFSVSIIRIIVDLSKSPERLDPRRNSDALHSISRWTIFAQGAIDAIIFQVIERQFRSRMKRKRRIAAGEAVDDPCWQIMVRGIVRIFRRGDAKQTPKADEKTGEIAQNEEAGDISEPLAALDHHGIT